MIDNDGRTEIVTALIRDEKVWIVLREDYDRIVNERYLFESQLKVAMEELRCIENTRTTHAEIYRGLAHGALSKIKYLAERD